MNAEEIQELSVNSSKIYYDYLSENNKGRSEIEVYSVDVVNREEGILKLRLSKKIFELDAVVFQIQPSGGRPF